jgi:hypothetical protein
MRALTNSDSKLTYSKLTYHQKHLGSLEKSLPVFFSLIIEIALGRYYTDEN